MINLVIFLIYQFVSHAEALDLRSSIKGVHLDLKSSNFHIINLASVNLLLEVLFRASATDMPAYAHSTKISKKKLEFSVGTFWLGVGLFRFSLSTSESFVTRDITFQYTLIRCATILLAGILVITTATRNTF